MSKDERLDARNFVPNYQRAVAAYEDHLAEKRRHKENQSVGSSSRLSPDNAALAAAHERYGRRRDHALIRAFQPAGPRPKLTVYEDLDFPDASVEAGTPATS